MSRGPGKMQRWLVLILIESGRETMTFAEIRASILKSWDNKFPSLYPSLERSLRRALKKLADDEVVLAIGDGGRADPTRYCLHPVFRGAELGEDFNAAFAAVQAMPGGTDALAKCIRRYRQGIERAQAELDASADQAKHSSP
jgi:hypothetical protein